MKNTYACSLTLRFFKDNQLNTTTTTLQDLIPQKSMFHKGSRMILWLLAMVILAVSYVYCGIDPIELIEKRENGIAYLFGHDITQADRDSAKRQAQKLPKIIIEQEISQSVRQEMKNEGIDNPIQFSTRVMARAEKELDQMDPVKKKALIDEEYLRLLDEKRGGYFPPEMRPNKLYMYTKSLIETIAMAIWGTLFAFVLAVPLSVFAARNTLRLFISSNSKRANFVREIIWFCMRRLLDFCRGFNEFVMALIFVAIIGLGPFAGVLALAIHTFGVLGKVFSEGIEAIDPGQVEAVEASGASPGQTITFAVLPQVMPLIVSYSLLRFESNVRSASILGFVGAGGIGYLIFDKINGYMYREVCTIMLLIIFTVTIIDYLCGILRKKFV